MVTAVDMNIADSGQGECGSLTKSTEKDDLFSCCKMLQQGMFNIQENIIQIPVRDP